MRALGDAGISLRDFFEKRIPQTVKTAGACVVRPSPVPTTGVDLERLSELVTRVSTDLSPFGDATRPFEELVSLEPLCP
jgi:hypothetical protein